MNLSHERLCNYCGKSYKGGPKYCSRLCANRAKRNGETRPCPQCGRMTYWSGSHSDRRFCSHKCWYEHNQGQNHVLWTGKVELKCPQCGKRFRVHPSQVERRHFCSIACSADWKREHWHGEDHPCWLGGYEDYYGPNWEQQRLKVRARDKVCQECGATPKELGQELDAHHIRPFSSFDSHKAANQLGNLICYCRSCHMRIEWMTNRGKNESVNGRTCAIAV